jgi:hypothetical protein
MTRADARAAALSTQHQEQLQQALQDLVKASQISSARKEEFNSHRVFVIDITVNDEALLQYFKRVKEVRSLSAEQDPANLDGLRQVLEATDEMKVTIKVDRSSFFIRHLVVPVKMNLQKWAELQPASSTTTTPLGRVDEMKSLEITLTSTLDAFNQPTTFEVPADARDYQEVLQELNSSGALDGLNSTFMPSPSPQVGGARPSELPPLSEEEKRLLKEYGVEVEKL